MTECLRFHRDNNNTTTNLQYNIYYKITITHISIFLLTSCTSPNAPLPMTLIISKSCTWSLELVIRSPNFSSENKQIKVTITAHFTVCRHTKFNLARHKPPTLFQIGTTITKNFEKNCCCVLETVIMHQYTSGQYPFSPLSYYFA